MSHYRNVMNGMILIILFLILAFNVTAIGEDGIKKTNTASARLIVVGIEQNDSNNTEELELMMDEQSEISLEEQYNEQRRLKTNQLTGYVVSEEGTQNIEKSLMSILIILSITLIGLLGYLYIQKRNI